MAGAVWGVASSWGEGEWVAIVLLSPRTTGWVAKCASEAVISGYTRVRRLGGCASSTSGAKWVFMPKLSVDRG